MIQEIWDEDLELLVGVSEPVVKQCGNCQWLIETRWHRTTTPGRAYCNLTNQNRDKSFVCKDHVWLDEF